MRIYQSPRWRGARRAALERDGWRCVKCGKAGRLEVDHIQPLHKGGAPFDLGNLRTLCRGCHIARTAQDKRKASMTPAWAALVNELRG